MTELERFKEMLHSADIPYEEGPGRTPGGHILLAVGTNDRAPTVFGLGGGYVGVFGFDDDGKLVDFGVMA